MELTAEWASETLLIVRYDAEQYLELNFEMMKRTWRGNRLSTRGPEPFKVKWRDGVLRLTLPNAGGALLLASPDSDWDPQGVVKQAILHHMVFHGL